MPNESSPDAPLAAVIRDEINARGPIPFVRFMELALYHPGFGYYRKTKKPFGRKGDFYTASQLQPVFGELIAAFAATLGERIAILELGAGAGEMRAALSRRHPYIGFDWGQDKLPEFFSGLIFANEFFDALPVHLLRKTKSEWRELHVSNVAAGFSWVESGVDDEAVLEYLAEYGSHIPEGALFEVPLETRRWIERAASILTHGTFLILDYGYSAEELKRFQEGTLLAYWEHQASDALLQAPGERDLTAHVNFTYLKTCARRVGFEVASESSLRAWVMDLWNEKELQRRWVKRDDRWRLKWKQLVLGWGENYRAIVLQKN